MSSFRSGWRQCGLGELDDPKAQSSLAELLKDRAELIRAEAVTAIAVHGPEASVLAAAADPSWRVRVKVAVALAGYSDSAASAAARRMLHDQNAEVERQVVRSVASWPLEAAVPVLLDALARDALSVRKLAADQLAARWPESERFPCEAPPHRSAALEELREPDAGGRYLLAQGEGARSTGFSRKADSIPAKAGTTNATDQRVEKLVSAGDFTVLAALGRDVVASLERLAIQRHVTLPEPVYGDVLPRYSPVFAALDRLDHGIGDIGGRRPRSWPFWPGSSRSAVSRRPLVRTDSPSERCCPVAQRLGRCARLVMRAGRTHAAWPPTTARARSVARRATIWRRTPIRRTSRSSCPAWPTMTNIVLAAIRALGAARKITDASPLRKCLSSANEEIELAAAVAPAAAGRRSGSR